MLSCQSDKCTNLISATREAWKRNKGDILKELTSGLDFDSSESFQGFLLNINLHSLKNGC